LWLLCVGKAVAIAASIRLRHDLAPRSGLGRDGLKQRDLGQRCRQRGGPADEGERVRNAYGPNYERLARVKRAYDANNLFRINQNVKPAA